MNENQMRFEEEIVVEAKTPPQVAYVEKIGGFGNRAREVLHTTPPSNFATTEDQLVPFYVIVPV